MTQKYKIIFFDLDGTLLTDQFELLPGTISAVNEIREAGIRVSLATGRSYKSARPFAERLNIIEPMVFGNGSVFDNPETDHRELIAGVPLETALIVLMLIPEFNISLKVHMPDGTVYKSDSVPWPDEGKHFDVGQIEPNLKMVLTEDPVKFVFYDPEKKVDRFSQKLEEILGRKNQVRFFRSHERYVEMTNKNVSKGQATLLLLEKLRISPNEAIGVGDQGNDLEMIRDLGLGVLAGKGTDALLAVCDHQIPPPSERGIESLKNWMKTTGIL